MAASTEELLDLAREVRDGVLEKFGVPLVNEPVMVGTHLSTGSGIRFLVLWSD